MNEYHVFFSDPAAVVGPLDQFNIKPGLGWGHSRLMRSGIRPPRFSSHTLPPARNQAFNEAHPIVFDPKRALNDEIFLCCSICCVLFLIFLPTPRAPQIDLQMSS